MSEAILSIHGLKKHFALKGSLFSTKVTAHVKAVDGVSFDVKRGETLGIVGESGCGKSTLARLVNQLIRPSAGEVIYEGKDLASLSKKDARAMRRNIQMVFQNPYASLDPRKTIRQLMLEPLVIHQVGTKKEREERVLSLLERVGLNRSHADRYPHEFSGGQRQRINIARALVLQPDIILCDEPVSALDVSVQAQVLNLLQELQKEFQLTYVFISHDLNVVRYLCDRIAVMYLGRVVEMGTSEELYSSPQHPYTKALLSAIPKSSPFEKKERTVLLGDVPSPVNPPSGCHFHERCPVAMAKCKTDSPVFKETIPGHQVACHLADTQGGN
ncbi:ABC transporter ATP-binding protein [Aureibacillus halotolerans]|uniref:Peptide/nickel transport system ATP-binding protein/oligopeptide transport system ATP-binding protein n=1 Tax=Aureibacillus halotolerans TaxID=1508390 RepID=A0A4R6TWB8_9BACI|nr:dipeptide ABC transporter ATP-binding protein [Aureibacillus halotolerans]TDQ36543.1 peptide/nickel transport system ATP-binding protein/oligopeptide transport system ATP-binding protein [Aureibacillus halotolerans]